VNRQISNGMFEAGPWQVYVSPFPSANSKWQVSTEGGEEPRWRRDGRELFYLSGGRKLLAVPAKTGNTFEAGPAVSLFQTHARQQTSVMDAFFYDVSADGQKFLINTRLEGGAAPLSVILNWASELERWVEMALGPGIKVAPYEIVAPPGAGGEHDSTQGRKSYFGLVHGVSTVDDLDESLGQRIFPYGMPRAGGPPSLHGLCVCR